MVEINWSNDRFPSFVSWKNEEGQDPYPPLPHSKNSHGIASELFKKLCAFVEKNDNREISSLKSDITSLKSDIKAKIAEFNDECDMGKHIFTDCNSQIKRSISNNKANQANCGQRLQSDLLQNYALCFSKIRKCNNSFKTAKTILKILCQVVDIGSKNSVGNSVIHCAISHYCTHDFIGLLLECGADPNAQNNQGLTPAHMLVIHIDYAAKLDFHSDSLRALDLLSDYGANFNIVTKKHAYDNEVKKRKEKDVSESITTNFGLILSGCNTDYSPESLSIENATAIHLAALYSTGEASTGSGVDDTALLVIEKLITLGAKIDLYANQDDKKVSLFDILKKNSPVPFDAELLSSQIIDFIKDKDCRFIKNSEKQNSKKISFTSLVNLFFKAAGIAASTVKILEVYTDWDLKDPKIYSTILALAIFLVLLIEFAADVKKLFSTPQTKVNTSSADTNGILIAR